MDSVPESRTVVIATWPRFDMAGSDEATPRASHEAPPRRTNAEGRTRTVGVEVELGRLTLERTLAIIHSVLGGEFVVESRAEGSVEDTVFGKFHVEFDHSILKERKYFRPLEKLGIIRDEASEMAQRVEDSVFQVAAEIVPVEVVTPPIPWDRLDELDALWRALREARAADTHDSLLYAFGLHFNPEIPDREASTLARYLKAFLLLEDWLVEASHIDVSRRLSPFIKSFPEAYRRMVLAPDYDPSSREFADDYLEYNPTRNRTLDLCPLLVHLHGDELLERIQERHLVKGRPTFHYRLPNCEIASPGWSTARDWNRWLMVERLGEDPALLAELSNAYLSTLDLPLRMQREGWVAELKKHLGEGVLDRAHIVASLLARR